MKFRKGDNYLSENQLKVDPLVIFRSIDIYDIVYILDNHCKLAAMFIHMEDS